MESLSDLFDNKWDDIIKDKQIDEINKEKIKQIKKDYKNITTFLRQNYLIKDIDEILEDKKDVSILNENVSLVSKIYYGKNNPIEKLKLIEKKVKNNDKLTEDEINFFKNFDIELNTIYEEKRKGLEGNENELKKLDDSYNKAIELYERLKNSDFAQKIEEIVNSGNFKKKNEIYWEDYIFIFRIFLTLFIYYCIITIIFILFISILGFLILIYDLIKNLIILFINKNNGYDINVNTLDYRFKKIINCTKDNFSNDRFLILNGQKQNIIIFNTCSYIMYLIIFYIMLYILVIIYSKTIEKQLVGNVDLLDPKFPFIILGIVFFIYSLIHLMFYKYVFRNLVFRPYKRLNEEEKEIDKIIDNYILIIGSEGEDENDKILIDNNFFELLFDASRIDELNNFFFMEINNKDPKKCLIQKIIIYNLYNYFNDYLIFDEDTQELFKKYCSNNYENKPLFNSDDSDPDGLKTTFISLINRSETKLIRKYHEELPYNDNISDENLEFYNKINKQVDKAINEINGKIITYNKTSLPFIITIIYLIILIIFNMAVVYLVVSLITSPTDKNPFNNYIVRLCEKLNEYIFNPIIQMFSNKLN